MLRRVRDDSMIDVPLVAYYKALCEAAGTPTGRGGFAAGPGMAGGPGFSAPPGAGMPAGAAPAPAAPRYPGLLKATAEENALLRAAIIEALGSIGGDHAGKALKTIADLEQKRNNDEMAPHLIAAFEKCKASTSIRDLCEYYVVKSPAATGSMRSRL